MITRRWYAGLVSPTGIGAARIAAATSSAAPSPSQRFFVAGTMAARATEPEPILESFCRLLDQRLGDLLTLVCLRAICSICFALLPRSSRGPFRVLHWRCEIRCSLPEHLHRSQPARAPLSDRKVPGRGRVQRVRAA